nr:glycosyltransferase family 2 protein [uncultured Anaerobutyricum sp.]
MPKISAIVPVYNVEKYLDRCINSLINQTLEDIEIILVDDGSPDDCPKMCDEYAQRDKRIRVIHKENGGLGFARNSGLEIARGEYIYFIDSDDYIAQNAFEIFYKEAKKNDADVCYGGFYLVDEENGKTIPIEHEYKGRDYVGDDIVNIVLYNMLGSDADAKSDANIRQSVWQGIYSGDLIRSNKLRFETERKYISEDIVFHLDFLPKAKKAVFVEGCYYYHIADNPTSLTHKYSESRFRRCRDLYIIEADKIQKLNMPEDSIERIKRAFIGNTRVSIQQIYQYAWDTKNKNIKKQVYEILEDAVFNKVLNSYDNRKNPIKQRLFSLFMKKKMVRELEMLVYFNNHINK